MAFRIKIEKDRIKFSSAHFTIFSATEAEKLHGHNYYVSIEVETEACDELGFAMDMRPLKEMAFALSQELDEYVLIPSKNPYLNVVQNGQQVDCAWNDKRYSLPHSDVKILPLSNITCENLAYWFWNQMKPKLPKTITRLKVSVKETHGQESMYENSI